MDKVISFCGIERGDFVYYIAALLNRSGKTVLVLDNSYQNDIYNSVSGYLDIYNNKEPAKFMVKQNITYMQNKRLDTGIDLDFDYVLIWMGMNVDNNMLARSDLAYLLPDYMPRTLIALQKQLKEKTAIRRIILRDSTESNKITEKTVAELLGMDIEKITDILVYDVRNYENYLAFVYNGRQTFNALSADFSKALQAVGMDILEIDAKEMKKVYSQSKKAR